ncbi:YggS family pyridoxal phosphate-dependent enzyme [bacterium]|nr:MAG: YggS family pyridoxal phosphate-dependent enzyme [bacterium]
MPIPSLSGIQKRIEFACARVGRKPSEVTLIGASKMVLAERLVEFQAAGLHTFGENYIQEGIQKVDFFREQGLAANWHCIGALQSNKAREAVAHFDVIHSVDRFSLAKELDKEARKIGKMQQVLLQVNVGAEASKAGVSPEELPELWHKVAGLENLSIQGLMSLPPFQENAEDSRVYHRTLRSLLEASSLPAGQLSMGMSHDFEIAIEEGATLIRVGTALFGARS